MLKGLDPLLDAELLFLLASMGHGDDLVLVDRNFPATSVALHTTTKKLILKDETDIARLTEAILSVFPLDSFVETPILRMEMADDPEALLEVHEAVLDVAREAEEDPVAMGSLERHAFYAAAKSAYAVVACLEARPYGCFLLKKGVIFD